jgi:hypothetical protein
MVRLSLSMFEVSILRQLIPWHSPELQEAASSAWQLKQRSALAEVLG